MQRLALKFRSRSQSRSISSTLLFLPLLLLQVGCVQLHHVQLGEIDNDSNMSYIPVEIRLNETGVSTEKLGAYAKATGSQAGKNLSQIALIISLFQTGPRTGNEVYSEKYADALFYQIYEKCPSGDLTGITALRESRSYDAVSGEYVTFKAYCKQKKETI